MCTHDNGMVAMPQDEMEWARSGKRGVDTPGGCPVVYNRSAATSTLGLDGGDNLWHQSALSLPGGAGRRGVEPPGEGDVLHCLRQEGWRDGGCAEQ